MRMAVVQIGPVRVRVLDPVVTVPVGVRSRHSLRMRVQMMPIIMRMGMDVLDRVVTVRVLVAAGDEHSNGGGKQQSRQALNAGHRFAEKRDAQGDAEEWRTGKDRLCAHGADALCGSGMQRDARAIRHRSCGERRCDRRSGRAQRCAQYAEEYVHRPGNRAFPKGAMRRHHPVDQRGQVIVDAPTGARADDQECRDHSRPADIAGHERARDDDPRYSDPGAAAQVLVEEPSSEDGGGDDLEIQEEGYGTRRRQPECREQQGRRNDAAEDDDTREPQPVQAVEPHSRAVDDHRRARCNGGSEIQQSRELQRLERLEELLTRRRGRPEQRSGREC